MYILSVKFCRCVVLYVCVCIQIFREMTNLEFYFCLLLMSVHSPENPAVQQVIDKEGCAFSSPMSNFLPATYNPIVLYIVSNCLRGYFIRTFSPYLEKSGLRLSARYITRFCHSTEPCLNCMGYA